MEVDSNTSRDTFVEKVELKEDSLLNSCLILTRCLSRTGKVDTRDVKSGSYGESRECRLSNLLVEARTASDIDILIAWRYLKLNIRVRSLGQKRFGLLCLVEFVKKVADNFTEIKARPWARAMRGSLG